MTEIAGILLAAGSAQRVGAPKLLQPLPNGIPVAVAAAQALMQVLPNTLAVVKPGDYALIQLFTELGLHIVENPLAHNGLGSSLAAGVNASARAGGWVIALADMPWIKPETISSVVERLVHGASIVAPVYAGRRGHPAGFASRWLEPLQSLSGDRGARDLIVQNAHQLELITTQDAGILKDIDYPQDLINPG